jgi:hypothetical protein
VTMPVTGSGPDRRSFNTHLSSAMLRQSYLMFTMPAGKRSRLRPGHKPASGSFDKALAMSHLASRSQWCHRLIATLNRKPAGRAVDLKLPRLARAFYLLPKNACVKFSSALTFRLPQSATTTVHHEPQCLLLTSATWTSSPWNRSGYLPLQIESTSRRKATNTAPRCRGQSNHPVLRSPWPFERRRAISTGPSENSPRLALALRSRRYPPGELM